jgi:hypothetical protein
MGKLLKYLQFNLLPITFLCILILFCLSPNPVLASKTIINFDHVFIAKDTSNIDSSKQRDLGDYISKLFKRKAPSKKQEKKLIISLVPTAGYTLSTGFTIGASSVSTFYTDSLHKGNESVINLQAFYDSHSQQTFITQSNLWTKNDQWKIVTDLRVNKYPDVTYGLGSSSKSINADSIAYNYIRFYQTFLKKVIKNLYAGGGYDLDYHYNIVQTGSASPKAASTFSKEIKKSYSHSSGINLGLLFDNRENPVNPLGGLYANFIFRDNFKAFGSDTKWTSLQVDIRKYFKLSESSNNVLAFWSYTWLILNGAPPYLDLPSVGNDTYNNTGRGYPIDRFRGRNMLYLEGEYRFGITANGLIGGVIFGNLESYPSSITKNINKFNPGYGPGIRIKINKQSNTNLGIDYGIGTDGSRGVFVNLGEVF